MVRFLSIQRSTLLTAAFSIRGPPGSCRDRERDRERAAALARAHGRCRAGRRRHEQHPGVGACALPAPERAHAREPRWSYCRHLLDGGKCGDEGDALGGEEPPGDTAAGHCSPAHGGRGRRDGRNRQRGDDTPCPPTRYSRYRVRRRYSRHPRPCAHSSSSRSRTRVFHACGCKGFGACAD